VRIGRLSPDEAIASLRSTREGLASDEAARRYAEFGPNRLEDVRRTPLWRRATRQFTHFFAVVLWIAAALAFWGALHGPESGMATLAIAIVAVVVINGAFSFWQEHRAEEALASLQAILPRQATVLRDGAAQRLPIATLVPGDIVLVQEGDDVPADCRLLEATALRVNLATVTGESAPQARSASPDAENDVLAARCLLLAGTSVLSGDGRAIVFATGMRTEFGKIVHLTQAAGEPASPLQIEIARLSRALALIAALLGLAFFAIGQALGLGFWVSFLFAIGIIVANVPEGLLPTVTLALAMATQRMANRNALIRRLPAAETLGAATVIVTDKTGTLTENRMSAVRAHFTIGGTRALASLSRTDAAALAPFFDCARHCHNAREVEDDGRRRLLGDPMEKALIEMAERILPSAPLVRIAELPFDADRRRMSTLHASPTGRVLYCKGAPESVLPLCRRALRPDGAVVPVARELREALLAAQDEMAEQGLRVLALAWRPLETIAPEGSEASSHNAVAGQPSPANLAAAAAVDRDQLESDLVFAGLVGLADPPRPEVAEAIARCRTAGIRVVMVTGDHPQTARAIALEIGLAAAPTVVTGGELARLSDAQLQLALDRPLDPGDTADGVVFARVTADQKMRVVDALKRKGHVVAATGDGVNDAPALRRADIGIAMGIAGTDVAREAADMVLLDDNFASIVAAVEEGRAVFQNIRKFLTYILTSNVPELIPYLAFALARIPLPLTVIQILAVDLGTDLVPALALGAEPPAKDTMQQPPRPRHERLISAALLVRAYLWLGMLQATAAMAGFFFVLTRGGWRYGDALASTAPLYREATTACLAAIVVMQVVNVFLCRDERQSVFALTLRSNPLLLGAIAAEILLILAIVYTPLGQSLFGTAPLSISTWLFMLPFALVMATLEEMRKAIVRARMHHPPPGLGTPPAARDPTARPHGQARIHRRPLGRRHHE
jgi:magnesium-transporting ATPase (P-type)